MYVDLGAEEVLAAEKGGRKIAAEIKSFLGPFEMKDLEQALGQFQLYQIVLAESKPEHTLYLAVPQYVVEDLFQEPIGQLLLEKGAVRVIGFDPAEEIVTAWIP